ncbi:LysR family transcriptional regulator [Tropicimonas sediminicola]|uniref:Transcriptional regulator, LysR family n=1 Tax=Tropicimonas sediminicola TaxID=1031541 RepID=A0A239L8T9_9RHOB|nr:LysR family transcriptional regulator [Tropicimonas sediminicola]SNT26700.1 transcriptional regulator, LysR family [Tropicimonas sediminicola]
MHELPQTRDLAVFLAVVDHGGFAEAGRVLRNAPSTLSRTVSRLEAELGVKLLRRSTRAIELTPEGRDLLGAAREIVARAERLSDLASQSRAPRGPLRVDAPVPFVLHRLAPRLAEFHSLYPEIALTLDMSDAVLDLLGSQTDVAVRFGTLSDSGMLRRRLGRTGWTLVAAPAYLERLGHPKRPEDLAEFGQVRFAAPEHINDLRFRGLPAPIRPRPTVTATNGEAVRRLVLGGLGIARFSDYMVADDLAAGRLVALFPGELDAEPLDITALYLTRASGLRRLAAFLDWLEEILRPDS